MCPSGEEHSRQRGRSLLSIFCETVASARSRGFYEGQDRSGCCSSRNLWPGCLVLLALGEGYRGGMTWGLRVALMADS